MTGRLGLTWLVCGCSLWLLGTAAAQTADTPAATAKPPVVTAEAPIPPAPPLGPPDTIEIKNAQGENVRLPRTPLLEDLLRELAQRREKPNAEPQAGSVASVFLEGTCEGERALLKCKLQVQILPADRWVQVPLRMGEGLLRGFEYHGPGEAASGSVDPQQGYTWWFRGAGVHELDLSLSIPVRQELPVRRLQLALPATVVSQLKLQVPQSNVSAKTEERSRLNTTPQMPAGTLIDVLGLGSRLDLSWQPQSDPGMTQASLEVRTSLLASIVGKSVILEANQRVQALQGNFNSVQVRLPRNSTLSKLEGQSYKEHTVEAADPGLITVQLKETYSGNSVADLKWTVQVDLDDDVDEFVLDGFEVARAKAQTGHLGLRLLVGDYRLAPSDKAAQFVQRDSVSTLTKVLPPMPPMDGVTSAYNILRQPFQLPLRLVREEPHVTVKPYLFLKLTEKQVDLYGVFNLQVYRGRIQEVAINWPQWKSEGWQIEPFDPPSRVEETILENPDHPDQIRVRLIEATKDSFQISFHAQRPLAAGLESVPLSLPTALAAGNEGADIVIALADNLEAEVRPLGDTNSRLQIINFDQAVEIPPQLNDLRRTAYRIEAATPSLAIATTVQKQRISVSSEVQLQPQGNAIEVQQKLLFDVAYERMSQVLVMVPEGILDRCWFVDAGGNTLAAIPTGLSEGTWKQHRLALPVVPKIGPFVITARFTLERPSTMSETPANTWVLPLVRSSDAPFTTVRVQVADTVEPRLNLTGNPWTPQPSAAGTREWLAVGSPTQMAWQVERQSLSAGKQLRVSRQLYHAAIDSHGNLTGRAWFLVSGAASSLRVQIPRDAKVTDFSWDRQALPSSAMEAVIEQPGVYQLDLPGPMEAGEERLLDIGYHWTPSSRNSKNLQQSWPVPHIMADSSGTHTLWLLQLPANEHLWMPPDELTPEYNWTWMNWYWTRVSRHGVRELENWLHLEDESLRDSLKWQGSVYEFSSRQPWNSVRYVILSRELIVLFGAGLALVLGFVLVNVRAMRHVLTFLGLGFAVALAAVWYTEPVLLLLQPALLGVALALLAAVGQLWWARPTPDAVLTVTPSSSLLAAGEQEFQFTPPSGETRSYQEPVAPPSEAGVGV